VSHALSPNILATSLVAKAVGEHTILYIGDASGNLAKVISYSLKKLKVNHQIKLRTAFSTFVEVPIMIVSRGFGCLVVDS